MHFLGIALTLLIGLTMGALGAGGSILAVPLLVYVFGLRPEVATSYSLVIVGSTALSGALSYARRGDLELRSALAFAAPSLLSVYATRRFLLPAVPTRFELGSLMIAKDTAIMVLFTALLVLAGLAMVRSRTPARASGPSRPSVLAVLGLFTGFLVGLVGVGGGFLIIPALVLLGGIEMKRAAGASLLIIAANSAVGVLGDLGAARTFDWPFLAGLVVVSLMGLVMGVLLSERLKGERLRPAFGVFVLIVALGIFVAELVRSAS